MMALARGEGAGAKAHFSAGDFFVGLKPHASTEGLMPRASTKGLFEVAR